MGEETINHLSDEIKDSDFNSHLRNQLKEYGEMRSAARSMLNEHGYDEKGISAFEKIRTYLMIDLQTLTDKSTSHIAEMLIIGSNMGVIQALRSLKKYRDAEEEIVGLMKRLLTTEENNIQQLKNFL
jgi:cytoplasmic iron level regulating protein YaaA (DUF328/UPF0246 family)